MKLKDKNVVVVGLGKSGMAALQLLKQEGANVCLYDGKTDLAVPEVEETVYLGMYPKEKFAKMDFAVFSPGVPMDIELADYFRVNNVPVIGEIELAYHVEKGKVIGITGTNGKTTTTTLVGEIMKAFNPNTYVVGNIGVPYTEMVEKTSSDSVTVAEISSFQLESIKKFAPKVSAILNITPDHLNRHKTMENYIRTKFDISKNQGPDDVCVLNYEDLVLREHAKDIPCKVVFFSSRTKLDKGVYLDDNGNFVWAETGKVLFNSKECNLLGEHNYENIMAAILMTTAMGVPMDVIERVVKNFNAVEHRIEFVVEKNGVAYYNDSKGTNPDAAIKGVQSMNRKTVLIGGGYDKGGDFDEWIEAFGDKVSHLILFGATKDRIAKTAKEHGFDQIIMVQDLKEAVDTASKLAKPGQAVLLSPACASWDMFKSYEQRGEMFKEFVKGLE